jgi:long-chain acyl-CoA synthetase
MSGRKLRVEEVPMERIWLQSYPHGIPADLPEPEFESLAAFADEACRHHAARTAFISMGRQMNYAELDRLSRDFAAW